VLTSETLAVLAAMTANKHYAVGGADWEFRLYNGRDYLAITGRLGLLPVDGKGGAVPLSRQNEIASELLCLCSVSPKITQDDPEVIPDGTIPVNRLPDAIFVELVSRLSTDSGFSAEATDAIRPSVATSESS
jgi:hypothetical protein